MTTSLRVGVDLDGVGFDYVENTRKIAKILWPDWEERGFTLDAPSTCWDYFRDDWGLTGKQFGELNRWGMEQGMVFEGPVVDGFVELLQNLRAAGHTIHIVTHRAMPGSVAVTDHWLRMHKIPYDSLSFVQNVADKTLLELDVLIDDKAENIASWTEAGREAIIYNQKWNEHYHGRGYRAFNPQHAFGIVQYIAKARAAAEAAAVVVEEEPETILQEAQRLVHGDRGADYGHPIEDFTRTGRIWGAILGLDRAVTPNEVALCMVGVKLSREVNRPKRDNRADGAGYFETLDMVVQKQEQS
jgi:hypothetical protein